MQCGTLHMAADSFIHHDALYFTTGRYLDLFAGLTETVVAAVVAAAAAAAAVAQKDGSNADNVY
jgi:hypothetical protein